MLYVFLWDNGCLEAEGLKMAFSAFLGSEVNEATVRDKGIFIYFGNSRDTMVW